MGEEDHNVLRKYASKVSGEIVEIGAYAGKSARVLALASPKSHITTIDSYIDWHYKDIGEALKIRGKCLKEISGLNVTLISKTSEFVGRNWNTPIDLLHIDGDHNYEAVKSDISLFVPHVSGVVLLHDYTVQEFGVAKAVKELKDYFKSIKREAGFAVCRI